VAARIRDKQTRISDFKENISGVYYSTVTVIVNDSPDYHGHDHSWTSPDSWCRSRRVVTEARQRIKDALSTRHDGGDLQAIKYVAYHTYRISLVTTDIATYRSRLVLGPQRQ